jgi:hypothetical protein
MNSVKIAVKRLGDHGSIYQESIVTRKLSPGSGHPLKSDDEIALEHGCFIVREADIPSISGNQKYGSVENIEDGIYLIKERPVLELTGEEVAERAAGLRDLIIAGIKREAQRRIFEVMPIHKQLNLQTRALWLLRTGESNWTTDQKETAAKDEQSLQYIKEIRSRSNELEAALPDDYTADKHWVI